MAVLKFAALARQTHTVRQSQNASVPVLSPQPHLPHYQLPLDTRRALGPGATTHQHSADYLPANKNRSSRVVRSDPASSSAGPVGAKLIDNQPRLAIEAQTRGDATTDAESDGPDPGEDCATGPSERDRAKSEGNDDDESDEDDDDDDDAFVSLLLNEIRGLRRRVVELELEAETAILAAVQDAEDTADEEMRRVEAEFGKRLREEVRWKFCSEKALSNVRPFSIMHATLRS